MTDVAGYQPVAELLGLTTGDKGVNGIPNTDSDADTPGSMAQIQISG